MSSIIRQIELANLAGVTRAVVYKGIRAGYIKTRTIGKVKKVVFDDDSTQLWFEKQKARISLENDPIEQKPQKKTNNTGKSTAQSNLATLQQQKTLEEIRKITADANLKELKYSKERGDLIEKETLAAVLFQYLDALNHNMLTLPDMVIDVLIDKIKSGASRGSIIKIMRDKITNEIKNTKGSVKERFK